MFSQFKQNKSLTLLVSLLLFILVFPFFETSRVGSVLFIILYTTVLLAGIYAVSYDVRTIAIGLLLVVPILVCQWSNIILNSAAIDVLGRAAAAVFMSYTLVALLQRVLTARRIGLNEIYGAICAYVLIGTLFGLFYVLLETAAPGSFHFEYDRDVHTVAPFVYFSFVALSTAGFGDIVAVAPLARSIVIIETIIGVTYVGVLIGRLISVSRLGSKTEQDRASAERYQRGKQLHDLLRETAPLKHRPIGLVAASVLLNFVPALLMMHTHLPFFLDSWATSLAVMLGGWQAGAMTAVLYNLLIAAVYWGWPSWVWMFSSLLVTALTWLFFKRGWISLYKPVRLIAAGVLTGLANGVLAQITVKLAHLPPYAETLPVYSFFLKLTSNTFVAELAEKMFVEVGDKTISILVAAVAIFLLRDLLAAYQKRVEGLSLAER